MTWLDLTCALFLLLAGAGGYSQGFIRGSLRLLVLLSTGVLGVLFALRPDSLATARTTLQWSAAGALLGFAVAAFLAWSANRAIPDFVHRSPANRLLGILPAAGIALMILVLGLGVGERLTASSTAQAFLRSGILTGPLVGAGDLIEQMVAGVH